MTVPRCLLVLSLSCASLAWPAARAAEPAPASTSASTRGGNTLTLPGGQATGRVAGRLTRDQLRQCLTQQQSLQDTDASIARTQAGLQTQKTELARERKVLEDAGTALDAERATVDATQAAAVDAYNAKLVQRREVMARHEAAVGAYNAALRPHNEQVDALNTTRTAWFGTCADRIYDEADFFAIQRGK